MPTVSISKDLLYKALGKSYSDVEFDELCFQFGIEVDDIVDDPEKGITFKIEVGANRYDLLCLEGIARALNVFNGRQKLPNFRRLPPRQPNEYKLIVKSNTEKVRPFVVGAVLRNVRFTKEIYDSFIDLQDKLHQNIARKRTLVAIGTHDLDTIKGPFIYDAQPPKDITFIALNQSQPKSADVLLEEFTQDLHLREYVPIIKDKPVYPVIRDKNGVVLSLPPIINGDHSKITLDTKNIFIECTATNKFKAQVVLDTIVCMFSQYCKKKFTVEAVQVEYPDGETIEYPILEERLQETTASYCNRVVGVQEPSSEIASLLSRMCLEAQVSKDDAEKIVIKVPPTRYDILHECDVAGNFAVAYGFDRLASDMKMPTTNTIGKEFELNARANKMRLLLSQNNYIEALTFTLCSKADIGKKLRINLEDEPFVEVGNPKTTDFEVVRNSLLPGILKMINSNKHIALPIRIFEVGDVVVRDEDPAKTLGVGARNERHLCAVNYNVKPGVELVQGLLENIMNGLHIPYVEDQQITKKGYWLVEKDHRSFFPGWSAAVYVNGVEVGYLGCLHPEVIKNFNLKYPAAAVTLNLQKIFEISKL